MEAEGLRGGSVNEQQHTTADCSGGDRRMGQAAAQPRRLVIARWLLVALLVAALLPTSGCKDQTPAADLLSQGATAATSLRAYYESLEQTVLDSWEFEAAFSNVTGVSFGAKEESTYQDRISSLHARTVMARELADLYGAASQLRGGSDAEARSAAEQLGETLKGIPKLPLAGIDPAEPLGKAAETLLGFARTRDLKTANRSLVTVLDGMSALYSKETPAYRTLSAEREQSALHVLETLSGLKMVSVTPLLHDLAARLGAPWNDAGGGQPQAVSTGLAIARIRARRAELLTARATDETGAMLGELAARHRGLIRGNVGSLKALREATEQASTCLQQRAELLRATRQ
jgi:hypothetical protein